MWISSCPQQQVVAVVVLRADERLRGDPGGSSSSLAGGPDEAWPVALPAADAAWAAEEAREESQVANVTAPESTARVRPDQLQHQAAAAGTSEAQGGAGVPHDPLPLSRCCNPEVFKALSAAWLPFAAGWKRVW